MSSQANQKYVLLQSNDNFEFIIPLEAANHSGMIHNLLSGFDNVTQESGHSTVVGTSYSNVYRIPLDNCSSGVLQVICQYLVEKESSHGTMSEFKALHSLDTEKEEDKKLVLEVLVAADFLDC